MRSSCEDVRENDILIRISFPLLFSNHHQNACYVQYDEWSDIRENRRHRRTKEFLEEKVFIYRIEIDEKTSLIYLADTIEQNFQFVREKKNYLVIKIYLTVGMFKT